MGLGGWIKDKASDAVDTVSDGVDFVTDTVSDGVDAVTDTVSDGVDFVTDVGSGAFNWMGDRISDIGSSIGDAIGWLKDRALGWLKSLWNPFKWVFDALEWVFNGLTDWWHGFLDALRDLVRGFNAPDTLSDTARAWQSGPIAKLQGLEQNISAQTLLADDGWTDDAGRAYVATIPGQVGAVTGVRDLATRTAQSLTDASESLKTLYAEAGGIVGRVYAAVNGSPGSLFNLEALLEVMNLDFDRMVDVMKAVKDFSEDMQEQKQALAAQATSHPAFPGGQWPRAVTA